MFRFVIFDRLVLSTWSTILVVCMRQLFQFNILFFALFSPRSVLIHAHILLLCLFLASPRFVLWSAFKGYELFVICMNFQCSIIWICIIRVNCWCERIRLYDFIHFLPHFVLKCFRRLWKYANRNRKRYDPHKMKREITSNGIFRRIFCLSTQNWMWEWYDKELNLMRFFLLFQKCESADDGVQRH